MLRLCLRSSSCAWLVFRFIFSPHAVFPFFFFRQAQDARHLGWLGPEGQVPARLRPRSPSTFAVACAWLVVLVTLHPTLCSLRLSTGLLCQASWLVLWKWPRSSSLRQWHVCCWFAGVDAIRAVFLLMVGRPVMPGIMGVAILVVPASRAAPSWTSPSFVVTGSRGTARDGSDPRLLFPAPSVFACTVVRFGLRAFSSLSLEMDVSAAAMVSPMLSPMVWQRLVQSLR